MNTRRAQSARFTRSTRRLLLVTLLALAGLAIAAVPDVIPSAHAQAASPVADGPRLPRPIPTISPWPGGRPPIRRLSADWGSVVFLSNRADPRSGLNQVFVKHDVNDAAAPVQITDEPNGARSPRWCPNPMTGPHVAYIAPDAARGDAIKVVRLDATPTTVFTFHASSAPDLGANLAYLTWSNSRNGDMLCFAHYDEWSTRGLACLYFPEHRENPRLAFVSYKVLEVIKPGKNPAPAESAFSMNDDTLYFSGDTPAGRGFLYSIKLLMFDDILVAMNLAPLRDQDGQHIRDAFAPSVGEPSLGAGEVMIFNSEKYAADPKRREELMMVDLETGKVTELTNMPGNQYGHFHRDFGGTEKFVMQSREDMTIEGHDDLYIVSDLLSVADTMTRLDIADANNVYDDTAPDWF